VELILPCPTSAGPRSEADSLRGRNYSCQVKAWSRSLPRSHHAPVNEGVAEEVVLPDE
jgi:hypothetical protein